MAIGLLFARESFSAVIDWLTANLEQSLGPASDLPAIDGLFRRQQFRPPDGR
jgi:hypothetical protein